MANSWWVWYNVQSGQPAQVIQEPSAAAVENATGFPPLAGPFATKAEAENSVNTTFKSTKAVHPKIPGLSGLAAIGDFFSRLTQPHTWLRVAEVVAGAILIIVGLNALLKQTTGLDPVGATAKGARTLAAVA